MKTQALLLPFLTLTCLMAAAPAFADCVLIRQYQDGKRIMQHFSTQILKEGKDIATSCTTACREEAVYIPAIDAAKLRGNNEVRDVVLRCSYSAGRGTDPKSGRVLAESTLPVTKLRIRKETAPKPRFNTSPYAVSPRAPAAASSSNKVSGDANTSSSTSTQQKPNYDLSPRHPQNRQSSNTTSPYERPSRPVGTTRY